MTRNSKILLAAALLGLGASVAISAPGYGGYGPGYGMNGGGCPRAAIGVPGTPGLQGQGSFAEQRLSGLESALRLTDAQKPVWEAFKSAVTAQSSAMIAHRQGVLQSGTRPDYDRRVAWMSERLEGMKRVAIAADTLKAQLTPEQQAVFDQGLGPRGYGRRGF